jgi:hypothetical protein
MPDINDTVANQVRPLGGDTTTPQVMYSPDPDADDDINKQVADELLDGTPA